MSIRRVRDEPGKDRGMAYLALLWALPSVGMSQNKVDVFLDRSPEFWRMSVLYVCSCAFIQVFHKISQNLYGRFIARKGRQIVIADLG